MASAVVYRKSLNKFGEEVCGDNYQVSKTKDSKIVVLSDGLGSGIKASILSILTTEIISTMMRMGVDIDEVVNTIAKTLPVCKVRGIAYSTFTIIQIYNNGNIRIVNYDNPSPVIIKKGDIYYPDYKETLVDDKKIFVTNITLDPNDFIFALSDGIVHAGLGNLMDFGWGLDNIAPYLKRIYRRTNDLKYIVDNLVELTDSYYGFRAGDDATMVGIKITENPRCMILTGPPLDPKTDYFYVQKLLDYDGKKVVCGGTTSNIVSRISKKELEIDIKDIKKNDLPPYGKMSGIDLVTEGVLTLQALNKILLCCKKNMYELDFDGNDKAAEKLFLILRDCDEIDFLVGRKVNAFYHNPALPFDMSIRSNLIRDISKNLERLGKEIKVEYC